MAWTVDVGCRANFIQATHAGDEDYNPLANVRQPYTTRSRRCDVQLVYGMVQARESRMVEEHGSSASGLCVGEHHPF